MGFFRRGLLSLFLISFFPIATADERDIQGLVILDYDGTILPSKQTLPGLVRAVSAYVRRNKQDAKSILKGYQNSQEFTNICVEQDNRVYSFLKALENQKREVLFLTDSDSLWLLSSARFALPRTFREFIKPNLINITSTYQYSHPVGSDPLPTEQATLCKSYVLAYCAEQLQKYKNIVSIGDGLSEQLAAGVLNVRLRAKDWKGLLFHVVVREIEEGMYEKIIEWMSPEKEGFEVPSCWLQEGVSVEEWMQNNKDKEFWALPLDDLKGSPSSLSLAEF